jgi:hypothetical protein
MRRAVALLCCGLMLLLSACSVKSEGVHERPVPISAAVGGSSGSKVLQVRDAGGGCDVDRVVVTRQDQGEVQLKLLRHDTSGAGNVCRAVAWTGTVVVELQQPLGKRRLVDAATAQILQLTRSYR